MKIRLPLTKFKVSNPFNIKRKINPEELTVEFTKVLSKKIKVKRSAKKSGAKKRIIWEKFA